LSVASLQLSETTFAGTWTARPAHHAQKQNTLKTVGSFQLPVVSEFAAAFEQKSGNCSFSFSAIRRGKSAFSEN
jgi:ABC-type phosphate transport system substrate-binding protein